MSKFSSFRDIIKKYTILEDRGCLSLGKQVLCCSGYGGIGYVANLKQTTLQNYIVTQPENP